MAPLSGHALPLPVAFQEPLFPFKLMDRSFVPPTTLSIRKNADRSATVLTVCCMRLASAIVAHVPCVPNVKKAFPPANHDGSVPFSGPSLPLRWFPLHPFSGRKMLSPSCQLSSRVPRSFGEIGHAVTF